MQLKQGAVQLQLREAGCPAMAGVQDGPRGREAGRRRRYIPRRPTLTEGAL